MHVVRVFVCMKRIAIIGSSGAGKTQLARDLGSILNIDVIHLDRIFWQFCWKSISSDERKDSLQELVQQKHLQGQWQWIIEGTFLRSSEPHLKKADTIIFLDLPTWLCLLRIIYRHIRCRKQPRPDLLDGCSDNLNLKRILKVLFFRIRHHQELSQKMHSYELDKEIIWLRSPKEVNSFLVQIQKQWDTRELYNEQLIASRSHPFWKAIERTLARSIAPLHSEIWYQVLLASEQYPALLATESILRRDR